MRLEVWSTYVTLLNATAVYGTLAASVPSGKRKRGDDEEMPPAGPSPVDLLTEQVPALTKALLGQLRPPKVCVAFRFIRSPLAMHATLPRMLPLPRTIPSHATRHTPTNHLS